MPKLKPHKGLLKRVKITARGKVKYPKSGKQKLNGHLSANKLRDLRGKRLAHRDDIRKFEKMLHRSLSGRR